ncbi:hypothetical protein AM493_02400 [Flavobacterium akiainvivens]|uniref:DUF2520 domain-containing protein n=1 Tax=Flavobacterium akiainvivens TaxID=1202724 RepID=A0A0M8M8Z9_9FLAO|nr:Rossmann-like and DUF2520 domain-containing protein [Flavobacterium akiainvivens]KOS05015.1 hypothetical protein AM493_02400 [Flavobacterium akiainvivens]SFQ40303.1 Rossmann-like domain-containing protein [Flavobacterium akiainvivens]
MIKAVVIGSGNVAAHLIKALGSSPQVQLVQAVARRPEQLEGVLPPEKITHNFNEITEADVYLISVTDGAIAQVSAQLPFTGRLVVHTSGSTDMEALDAKNRRGVFYPLQTFSKAKDVDFKAIPLCLEAENEADFDTLRTLAEALSNSVYSISQAQRQALHVAAVFVSNFANHMYAQGAKVCEEHGIPFAILQPLIQETAAKVATLHPLQAQTGPAIRHDEKTIQRHLDFIINKHQKAIYTLLTQSIQDEQKL